jgi:NitT/TauT family transport system permease protein
MSGIADQPPAMSDERSLASAGHGGSRLADPSSASEAPGGPAPDHSSIRAGSSLGRAAARILPPVAVFVIVTVLAEVLVQTGVVWEYILPRPSQVLRELATNRTLWHAAGQTGLSAVMALVLSTAIGILGAVGLSSARWVERAFYPYAVFFQTVPIIAIAPLLVIYLGYGMQTIVASSFIVSIFPVLASTFTGLRSTDPALVDLFRLYGAGRLATLWKLRLPAALPSILTGLRVAAGLAVIGAIVGELIGGGSGLGDEIEAARTRQRADMVFAAILLAALLGLAMFAIINLISRLMLRHWHASEARGD